MRRILAGLLMVVAIGAMLPAHADGNCFPIPEVICTEIPVPVDPPYDAQVVVAQSTFAPTEVEGKFGDRIVFHSFDTVSHTVTDPGCLPTAPPGSPCRFDVAVPIGARANRAAAIVLTVGFERQDPTNTALKPYTYVCRLHNETGTFWVS